MFFFFLVLWFEVSYIAESVPGWSWKKVSPRSGSTDVRSWEHILVRVGTSFYTLLTMSSCPNTIMSLANYLILYLLALPKPLEESFNFYQWGLAQFIWPQHQECFHHHFRFSFYRWRFSCNLRRTPESFWITTAFIIIIHDIYLLSKFVSSKHLKLSSLFFVFEYKDERV